MLVELSKPVPDPAATAYINAVTAARGLAPTSRQQEAIHTFFRAEKEGGRWSLHKRLYLPIWENPAANGIDMKSGTALGTFTTGVTHAPGYVQSDGVNGFFDFGVSMVGIGATVNNGSLFMLLTPGSPALVTLGPWSTALGARDADNTGMTAFSQTGLSDRYSYWYGNIGQDLPVFDVGIMQISRTAPTVLNTHMRTGAGLNVWYGITDLSTKMSTANMIAMGIRIGTVNTATTSRQRLGAYGIGLGFSDANAAAFTLNLKTLWETCTGQALP
jgi:hypothetical protein